MKPRLIIVTDPVYTDDALLRAIEAVATTVPPGMLAVQLRDKKRPVVSLRVLASRLRVLTRAKGAALVINGDAQLAKDVGADGVHLGGGAISIAEARRICGPQTWVSIAAHGDDVVRTAVREGADGVLVSPIFAKNPRGVAAIESACAIAKDKVAVYALGGISSLNAAECVRAGAYGVAVIRAIFASDDPTAEARAFSAALGARV